MRARSWRAVLAMAIVASGLVTVSAGTGHGLGGGNAGDLSGGDTGGTGTSVTSSGWNDWGCTPSAAHPRPVVLLHGLGGQGDEAWTSLAPYLTSRGWCVFSLTYGEDQPLGLFPFGGVGPIVESAQQISGFVDQVLAATGADRVDLVGHSEGGGIALYIPKVLDRADDIATVVTLGAGVYGEEELGTDDVIDLVDSRPFLEALARGMRCQACTDALPGSAFRAPLVDGPVAQPGVAYTLIFTRIDEVGLLFDPLTSPFLDEPGVRNRYVQTTCPLDLVGHSQLPQSRSVAGMVVEALDPAHAPPVRCGIGIPLPVPLPLGLPLGR